MVRTYKPIETACKDNWHGGRFARHDYTAQMPLERRGYGHTNQALSDCRRCGFKNPRPRPGAIKWATAKKKGAWG